MRLNARVQLIYLDGSIGSKSKVLSASCPHSHGTWLCKSDKKRESRRIEAFSGLLKVVKL